MPISKIVVLPFEVRMLDLYALTHNIGRDKFDKGC